jgi:hypothetical protein
VKRRSPRVVRGCPALPFDQRRATWCAAMANSHFLNRSSVTLLSSFVERSVSCASTSPTTVSAPTAKAVAGAASTRNTTRCVRSWTAKAGHRSGLTHVISHLKAALKRGTNTCPSGRLLSQFAKPQVHAFGPSPHPFSAHDTLHPDRADHVR